eukprot:scaffold91415_cov61-Attheya_sp.AAC.7
MMLLLGHVKNLRFRICRHIHGGDLAAGINFHGVPVESARKYFMLDLTGLWRRVLTACRHILLPAGGEILDHDLSGFRGVSPCLALSLPKRAMYASGMFVLEIGDEFPVEHPLGHSLRGTSRLLVCKKGTNIGTLHQLINKSSDKVGWWNGYLRINDHVQKSESTAVEF